MKLDTDGYFIVKKSRRGPIDQPADAHSFTGQARLEVAPSPDVTLFGTFGYFSEDRNNGTPLQKNDTELGTLSLGGSFRTADGSVWRTTVYSQTESFHSTFSTQALDRASEQKALDQESPSVMAGGSLQWNKTIGAHALLAGVDSRWVTGDTDENVSVNNRVARTRVAGGQQVFAGVFFQDAWTVTPWLEITGAIRGDYWQAYSGERREDFPPAGVPARQEFRDVDALEGNRLAQVPDNVVTVGLHFSDPAWFDASLMVRRVGGQFEDDLNTLPLGAYTTVDVRIGRRIAKFLDLYLAVENLFDETYSVGRTSEGVISVGAPRIVHGGLRLNF